MPNRILWIASVRADILTGDVGKKITVSVSVAVQNEAALFPLVRGTISPASEKKPEFQRHVEARKARVLVNRYRGEVVYAVAADLNYSLNLKETGVARVILFQRTTSNKAEGVYSKDYGIEDRSIAGVEGAIDENVVTS